MEEWMYRLWMATRIFRWALIPLYLAYLIEFMVNRKAHLDWRGLLLLSTETVMFGLPTLFVFVGMFESMLRERAGIPRPRNFGFAPSDEEKAAATHQFER
jgi:hypothetical protein